MTEQGDGSSGRGCATVLAVVVGVLVLAGLAFGLAPALLREPTASAAYAVAGDDHRVAAALVVLAAAAVAPLGVAASRLRSRSRAAGGAVLVPAAVLALAVLGLTPGRSDSGGAASSLSLHVGVLDAGEVLTSAAVASLLAAVVSLPLAALGGLRWGGRSPAAPHGAGGTAVGRVRRRRLAVAATTYGAVWLVTLVLVVAVVVPRVTG